MTDSLTIFRTNFPLHRVMVYDDYLVYKVKRGKSDYWSKEAEILIGKMGLNLIARSTGFLAKDSLVIENKN